MQKLEMVYLGYMIAGVILGIVIGSMSESVGIDDTGLAFGIGGVVAATWIAPAIPVYYVLKYLRNRSEKNQMAI